MDVRVRLAVDDALAEMRCSYCGVTGEQDAAPCVELASTGTFVTRRRHVYVIASARLRGLLRRVVDPDGEHSSITIPPQSLR